MSSFNFGPAIVEARAFGAQHQFPVKVSHAQEVLASMFGYKTYSALLIEQSLAPEGQGLDAAEHFIVNVEWGIQRCRAKGWSEDLAACCLAGVRAAIPRAYETVDDFWHAVARDAVTAHVYEDPDLAAQMAETGNITFDPDPDGFELESESGNFWQAREQWTLTTSGEMQGERDDGDGQPLALDEAIDVWARAVYRKSGRAGLIFDRVEFSTQPW
ncbi:MAG: hypothetical protein RSP_17590 [Rhodanobacter sp.]